MPAGRTGSLALVRDEDEPTIWATPLPKSAWLMALFVVALNLIDAFGTLRHLSHGAEELNPIMSGLLGHGPIAFVVGKHLLACGGILGILGHFRYRAAVIALRWVLFPIYLGIATYQIALFAIIP